MTHARSVETTSAKAVLCLVLVALVGCLPVAAQKTKARAAKLPSPEKIVGDYLQAVGGKKRQAAIRDASYEWTINGESGAATARTLEKAPAATRTDLILASGERNAVATLRSAWVRDQKGKLRTLAGDEAGGAKLQAALDAGRFADYKKQDVLARTIELSGTGGDETEAGYVVEFSRRSGARVRCRFGATSKLLAQCADEAGQMLVRYRDYRATTNGLLEPHRLEIERVGESSLRLTLRAVRYNTGLSDALFDPPGNEALDVPAVLREVATNQDALDERISEYTFTRTETEREIDDKGVVKKEKTEVNEIYPVAGGGRVLKLISENGVPLTAERQAKEAQRVVEEVQKLERENRKRKEKLARDRAARAEKPRKETGGGENGDDDFGISTFLRVCEFVAPRHEQFQGRDAIVFDFRARPGFKPASRDESLIAKLVGVAWIDPADKQVMRLEARLAEGFKVGGGFLASVRPGAAIVFEQTRLGDGVWLPRFSQISAAAKLFFLAGIRLDATREYSNYKRFSTSSDDAKINAPTVP